MEPDAAGALPEVLPVEPLPAVDPLPVDPLPVDPLDALPLGWVESLEVELLLELGAGELGAPLTEPLALVEPPEAESFFVASLDEDALEDGELGVVAEPDTEPELEPEGALAGGVVAPEDDEDVEPGWVVRARSPASSPHAVSKLAPKIMDTATAKVESLICWASVVGV